MKDKEDADLALLEAEFESNITASLMRSYDRGWFRAAAIWPIFCGLTLVVNSLAGIRWEMTCFVFTGWGLMNLYSYIKRLPPAAP